MTPRTPRVCVAVPVWRGADYVAETLESVLRQRGPALTVIVSVDGGDETSEAACRPFLADPRVRILVQPRRLGWVGNSSAALAAAAAEPVDYGCLQPHDDVLEDEYLAVLLAAAEANPDAAVVYSDIQSFGTLDRVIRQPTIAGSPLERQMGLLRDHFAAVAFRGLTRVSALRTILPMTGNPCENFAADTVWMARQALAGDLVRVPYALYRKRFHPNNTHTTWFAWPHERRMTAWIRHCLDMLAEALKASRTRSERRMLHRAARMRLLQEATSTGPYLEDLAGLNRLARARMRWRFEAAAALRASGGPPETGGRPRVGSRAVSALTHILAGRTLQDLVDS
ncbi:MAG: glycosyltransferase family 2 protein [Chloroflexota bacterium]|jgi:GT2 family glycosyltransferase